MVRLMVGISLKHMYREILRFPINRRNRKRLVNKSPSLISNNCNGAIILHDLGLRFNSPTVNLYIPFPGYIRFCSRLEHYLSLPVDAMVEGPRDAITGCPTGRLEDVDIKFVHYPSFEAARDKWFERARRVDMGNLFLMLSQRDGCTPDDVCEFDALPFEQKVALVAQPMPEVSCARYFPEFVSGGELKVITSYISRFSGRRIIDDFDFVGFLNGDNI